MITTAVLWRYYWWAVGTTLLLKLTWYMFNERPDKRLYASTVVNFFAVLGKYFYGTKEALITTVANIGFLWVFGASYIDRINFPVFDILNKVNYYRGVAVLLGSVGELGAPLAIKAVTKKFFGTSASPEPAPPRKHKTVAEKQDD